MEALLAGLFGYVVFACGLLLGRRLMPKTSPVVLLVPVGLASHAAGIVIASALLPSFQYWPYASTFALLVMGHILAFGAVYKSVSLHLLMEFADTKGPFPLSAANAQVERLFAGRAAILTESGLVERRGDSYAVTLPGQRLASRIGALQRLFGIKSGGLYRFQREHPADPKKSADATDPNSAV